ncbi:thiamine diphosphokinase [Pseudoprevotella muciniphila]|uniref:thiamine diphosphokinase n=1 Tax=Pseudoprevotella muciniphila TaxID=2133944 RepID=UPI001D02C10A|nr:thiamine diphosphokinase [Pseudoprevotella muciniphila]
MKITIIANGDFPTHPAPLSAIAEADYIACCDGAANACKAHGIVPDVIVGDADSISPALRQEWADKFVRIEDQDENDLTKTFNFVLQRFRNEQELHFYIVGATGKREDHTIANVALLMDYYDLLENQKLQATIIMMTDHGQFIPHSGKTVIASYKGQQVSIFAHDARNLKSTGLKWPIYDFKKYWQGTLNEALSDHFGIQAEGNYLVFLNY